ncbi:MAG TPA: protein-L-isoaspartate(D-aspartate) O-methyltransferase [Alphaproteobacteria bacterium]|nr:protein-L-isoaspartate(D-aspartate) O-methyltransferase [Alphaproteobacteria bacterium]
MVYDRDDDFEVMREAMLETIAIHARRAEPHSGRDHIGDAVLQALRTVPRHAFVPFEIQPYAYLDRPLPIGSGKTISQPFIVALMTDLLDVSSEHTVLEIGTGLGYQSAVLARLAGRVFTVEFIDELAEEAARRLAEQGITNVETRLGDGARGWPEHAPFDRIMVTAAPDLVPPALLVQLKPGGRMVVPAGIPDDQKLLVVTKDAGGRIAMQEIMAVRFSELESEDDDVARLA